MEIGFFSSTIVQVALAIIISWALFALLCSMIHEVVVRLKSERGRFYRTKINDKLFDTSNHINWGILMYNHSAIKLFTKSEKAPPAAISSNTMAEVLIDVVANCQAAQILKFNKAETMPIFKSPLLNQFDFATTHLGQSDVIVLLRKALDKAKIKCRLADGFDEEKVYDCLTNALTIWFNEFNTRNSAWYKKLTQKRLFAVGFLVAIVTNVDSLALFEYYKGNPTARVALIDYYEKNKLQLEAFSAQYDTVSKTTTIDSAALQKTKADLIGLAKQVDRLKTNLEFPVGWTTASLNTLKAALPKNEQINTTIRSATPSNTPRESTEWTVFGIPWSTILYKIIGFIISAFAASLGAPFWFDILKKATTDTVIKKT
jgi:hypothetical protein